MRWKRKQAGEEADPCLTFKRYRNFRTRLHGPEQGIQPPVVDQALWDAIEMVDPSRFLSVGRPLPDHVEGLKPVFLDTLNGVDREAEKVKERLGKDPEAIVREFLRRSGDWLNNRTERHRWKEKMVEYIAQTLGERIFFVAPLDPNQDFYRKFHIRIYDNAMFFTENRVLLLEDEVTDEEEDIHRITLSDILYRDILYVWEPGNRFKIPGGQGSLRFLMVPERFSFLDEDFKGEKAYYERYDELYTWKYEGGSIEAPLNPTLWCVFEFRELRLFCHTPSEQILQGMAAFMRQMLDGRLDDARERWNDAVEEWERYAMDRLFEWKARSVKYEAEQAQLQAKRDQLQQELANLRRLGGRYSRCWACGEIVRSDINSKCSKCGWLKCSCGACDCGYTGPRFR